MKEFDELLTIIERLLGPGGCPWDQEQTLQTVREMILEEVCEVIDAINAHDHLMIQEELGDLLFNVVFCCKLGEKEGRLTLKQVIQGVSDKLVRRHPHVFGEAKAETSEAVLTQWEQIKKIEKGDNQPKSVLDRIPRSLPALARAQQVVKKMHKLQYPASVQVEQKSLTEEQLGTELLKLAAASQAAGLDAEMVLRKALVAREEELRAWEQEHSPS